MPLDIKTLSHPEFYAAYHEGRIKVHIDKYEAKKIIREGMLPIGFKQGQIILEWIWFFLLAASLLTLLYKWWIGTSIFILAAGLPEAIRRGAAKNVQDHMLKNPNFYYKSLEENLARIEII